MNDLCISNSGLRYEKSAIILKDKCVVGFFSKKLFIPMKQFFFTIYLFTAFYDLLANTLSLLNLVNSVNMPRMLKLNGQKFKEGEISRGRYYSCSTST